jgi:hypothetical protein
MRAQHSPAEQLAALQALDECKRRERRRETIVNVIAVVGSLALITLVTDAVIGIPWEAGDEVCIYTHSDFP